MVCATVLLASCGPAPESKSAEPAEGPNLEPSAVAVPLNIHSRLKASCAVIDQVSGEDLRLALPRLAESAEIEILHPQEYPGRGVALPEKMTVAETLDAMLIPNEWIWDVSGETVVIGKLDPEVLSSAISDPIKPQNLFNGALLCRRFSVYDESWGWSRYGQVDLMEEAQGAQEIIEWLLYWREGKEQGILRGGRVGLEVKETPDDDEADNEVSIYVVDTPAQVALVGRYVNSIHNPLPRPGAFANQVEDASPLLEARVYQGLCDSYIRENWDVDAMNWNMVVDPWVRDVHENLVEWLEAEVPGKWLCCYDDGQLYTRNIMWGVAPITGMDMEDWPGTGRFTVVAGPERLKAANEFFLQLQAECE